MPLDKRNIFLMMEQYRVDIPECKWLVYKWLFYGIQTPSILWFPHPLRFLTS